jgi:hypothetical protein
VETRLRKKASGERKAISFDERGETRSVPVMPVRLTAPPHGARHYLTGPDFGMVFRWEDDAKRATKIVLASDRDFSRVRAARPVAGNVFELSSAPPGNLYWRLTDAAGKPVSETGLAVVVHDLPPRPLSPGRGEIVSVAEKRGVHFAWTTVTGAARYRMELSDSRRSGNAARSFEADGPRFTMREELVESTYYWRVRALHPGGVEGPFSEMTGFRLITRPLPDAPELYDPEFKLDDE